MKQDLAVPVESHRLDLDGLRGVAIMLVACFHIWLGRVSGGVDVFLVLSGYFFVGSLLRHVTASQAPSAGWWFTISPIPRLIRLVRRLVPALAVVLIAVVIGTVVVFPQTRWLTTGREVVASALYYQNWYLAFRSQDYTAASSVNSPLQHVWSMAVQGQYFVVTLVTGLCIGALLKLAARKVSAAAHPAVLRVMVGIAITGVAAVSLYWATMRMEVNQPFNYYDTVARTWEPLAGGLMAVWAPTIKSCRLRSAMAFTGLGLILTSGWWIDGLRSYPGPWALVPVLATMALILSGSVSRAAAGSTGTPVNRLLATAVPVWLGSIAYAMYLWHWPLLIFYLSWSKSNHAGVVGGLFVLSTSIALAWGTCRFIEQPLRAGSHTALSTASCDVTEQGGQLRRRRPMTYTSVTVSLLLVGVLACGVAIKVWDHHVSSLRVDTANLDPTIYPGARALLDGMPVAPVDPQPSPLEVVKDLPITSLRGEISDFADPEVRVGTYGDTTASRTIALAGGSHSEFWITALDELGKRNNFKVTTYLKMGCPLSTDPMPTQRGVPYPGCFDWVQRAMQQIIADRPDAVFTTTTRPRDTAPGDWVPPTYLPIFARFAAAGIPVLGMRDTVWPHNDDGLIDTPTCLAEGGSANDCGTPRSLALEPTNPTLAILASNPNVLPLDLSEGLCNESMCPAVIGNIVVYHDWHHLSATFVRSLTPELWRQMRTSVPWLTP
ncbi:acyltransferase family protein [Williamsia muralis]|uniref:acyltransferase family protein n=1 Tax=Williamsia marianensis TaxID=85044 RepID=UPI002434EDC5|nr:acyltransferase family protein [Williamsia marianensis]